MEKGYGVFGKAYETMFKHDLHHPDSIDHEILRNMVLIDDGTIDILYDTPLEVSPDIVHHELYDFAAQFKGERDVDTVAHVLAFAKKIVDNFDQCFEAMLFGGTEKEIIDRGTDWCTDISRVGVALLQCLNIPARIAIVVNRSAAYHGHQVVEAYINNQYVMCDFLYGLMGFTNEAAAVKDLLKNQRLVREIYQQKIRCKEQLDTLVGLYGQGAISEYCIMKSNTYKVSKANDYYLKMMTLEQDGNWLLNEK